MKLEVNPRFIDSVNTFISEYRFQISGFLGLTLLTCFLAMIYHISKLGISGTNQKARSEAIKGILTTGISLSVLGSLSVWYLLITGAAFSL